MPTASPRRCRRRWTKPPAAARLQIEIQHRARHHAQTIEKAIRTGIEAEMKARRIAREAIHESESQFDQTELIRLLEEEMLEAAKNLEFERAAQLRDKLNEIKGVPTIRSADSWDPEVTESDQRTKIWQPKSKGKQ